MSCTLLVYLISIFSLVPPKRYLFAIIRHISSLYLCQPGLSSLIGRTSQPLYEVCLCIGSVGFSKRKLQTTRWWSVDRYAPLLTWTSNTDGSKSAETMPKSNLHQVYLCKFLCRKKVFMMHSALLQDSCTRSLPLSFTSASPCRLITPFHSTPSFLNCALNSAKLIADKGLTPSQGITNSFHEFRVQCTWVWAVYLDQISEPSNNLNLKMHTLSPSGINSSTQVGSWGLARIPTPAWANLAGSIPE